MKSDLLPSGYLGVDIFFVISGFVITSSISKRKEKYFKNFLFSFYSRRIKRIIPALIFFLLITCLLISFFNPDPTTDLKTAISSLIGASNIYLFIKSTDYFSEAIQLNPFTHTWSLGVEEQFYFIFPLITWFTGFVKNKKNGHEKLYRILSIISFISLAAFIYLYNVNQPAAYFLMPSRFWEIALGSLLFLSLKKEVFLINYLKKISPTIILFLITIILFLPKSFGLISTILIVFLTLILLVSLKKGKKIYSYFTNKKIVYLGKISYSLYLWHWGILSISRWTIGIHWWSVPFQILLIYFLASISYEHLENPIRNLRLNQIKVITIGLISIFFTSISISIKNYFSNKIYLGSQNLNSFLLRNKINNLNNKNCDFRGKNEFFEEKVKKCSFKNESQKEAISKLYFVGSSHSGTLSGLIGYLVRESNYENKSLYVGGTFFPSLESKFLPIDNNKDIRVAAEKYNFNQDKIEDFLLKNIKDKDIIIISNHLGTLFKFKKDNDKNDFIFKEKSLKVYFEKLDKFVKSMKLKNAKVIFFSPYPFFENWLENSYPNTLNCGQKQWFQKYNNKPKNCYVETSRSVLKISLSEINKNLKNLKKDNLNFHIFDSFEKLCPSNENDICSNTIKNKVYLYDQDHLNTFGGEYLGKEFLDFINRLESN